MADKRDSSKQRRARENRARRAALEARTKAAKEPKPTRPAAASASGSGPRSKASSTGAATAPPKGFFSKARAERGPRPGDLPVDVSTLEGSWLGKRMQVPGGRQVVMATILTIVLSVLRVFLPIPDPNFEGPREDAPDVSIFEALGAGAFVIVGLPVVVLLLATTFTLHPNRRRIWINCAVFVGLVVLFGGVEYLFSVGYLVFGIWKAKQVEGPLPRRGAVARDDDADDDVQDDVPDDADDEQVDDERAET